MALHQAHVVSYVTQYVSLSHSKLLLKREKHEDRQRAGCCFTSRRAAWLWEASLDMSILQIVLDMIVSDSVSP